VWKFNLTGNNLIYYTIRIFPSGAGRDANVWYVSC